MKVSRWMALSAVFSALLAVSLYGCYSFIRMPSTRSRNSVDLQYLQRAEYSYTARVKPSLLYDNRTEISAGEPLYLELVERLNITLQYNLIQTPKTVEMTDATLKCEVSAALSGGDWTKTYLLNPERASPTSFSDTFALNMTEIQGIVDTIGEETGIAIRAYRYEIRPHIQLKASAGTEQIEEEFTPTLTIRFEGGKIEFEGLSDTKPGSVAHRETETATRRFLGMTLPVANIRFASITASISLGALLAVSIRFTLQERASRPLLERLSGDIRDKIIEASEPPERIERATIVIGSLDDLAKVAEEAFKPIIHHGDIFYVLDGDLRYEFRMANVEEG